MKTFLTICIVLMLGTARGQTWINSSAYVVQIRTEKLKLDQFGKVELKFVECLVDGKTKLMLFDAECPIEVGMTLPLYEGHDVPKHIVLAGRKWYDYMQKYLNRVKS